MFEDRSQWELLVQVHNTTKTLLLKTEEVDPVHEFYYPPLMQQRDALDHIMRAAFAWVNPETIASQKDADGKPQDPGKYASRQIDKALGHAYRALFDAADWLSIVFRERIREIMSSYRPATIHAVLPEYRQKIEPDIEKICFEIAKLRNNKDIGNDGGLIGGVQVYCDLIDKLEKHLGVIRDAREQLEETEFGQDTKADLEMS